MMPVLPVRRFDRALVEPELKLEGRLSRVFRHAALIEPDRDGPLLTLLHPGRELTPLAIGIPWGLVQPRTGQRVVLTGRLLHVAEPGRLVRALRLEGPGVSLKLRPCWTDLEVLKKQLASFALPQRARVLLNPESPPGKGIQGLVIRAAARQLRELVGRLSESENETRSYHQVVNRLAGLGPGLTPTGDDLLVGVAAVARQFSRMGWLSEESVSAFHASLAALEPGTTTSVGHQMLQHAAQGSFPEPLLRFVYVLGEKGSSPRQAEREAGQLSSSGAYSGCDMLAGAVALADAVANRPAGVAS